MERKAQIAVGVIAIIAVAAIVGGVVVFLMAPPALGDTLVHGTAEGPVDLDPSYAWDSASIDVIDQVAEGLVRYNLDTNQIEPNLAESWTSSVGNSEHWGDQVNYSFVLEQGVTFHDGTPFTADSVVNSFNRLNYLLNATGALPDTVGVTQVAELYEWPNTRSHTGPLAELAQKPIINETFAVSTYVVNVTLNEAYAPFIPLLAFSASYIYIPLDEEGGTAVWDDYITTADGVIIGTGPWVYDGYEADVEVTFNANPNYWKGASAIPKLVFSVINDANARNAALLAGDVHFVDDPLPSLYPTFDADPNIVLYLAGQGLITQYLGFNTLLINTTWRNALSAAIDYEYITEEWWEGNAVRLESPVPLGITWANWSHQEAPTNLTHARLILQHMGFGLDDSAAQNPWGTDPDMDDDGVIDDADNLPAGLTDVNGDGDIDYDDTDNANWTSAARYTPFRFFNFTYNIGNQFREDIFQMLLSQFALVGVKIDAAGMTWRDFIYRLYEVGTFSRDMLQLYWIGWGPDYNDPSNFLNPLFTNRSVASNGAQYNAYIATQEAAAAKNSGADYASDWVTWTDMYTPGSGPRDPLNLWDNPQMLMEDALKELDAVRRQAMYDRIQMLLVEQDMPWGYGYVADQYDAHIVELEGYPYNTMGKLYFYPCEFVV
jgi:ABC-type transport system substrate-binding protein